MEWDTLYPPRGQHLSDSIVGRAVVRSGVRRLPSAQFCFEEHETGADAVTATQYNSQWGASSNIDVTVISSMSTRSHGFTKTRSKTTVKQLITSTPNVQSADTPGCQLKDEHMKLITVNGKIPAHKITPDLVEGLFRLDSKRRQQRRATQSRYRKKKSDRAAGLSIDTHRLKEEIKQLELQRNDLISRIPSESTPWGVVVEYYRLFRHGSKVPALTTESHNAMSTWCSKEAQIQAHFLYRAMAPDVSVNSGDGVNALLQEWRQLPQTGGDVTVNLVRLEYDERATILATVRVYVTITAEMLHFSFPQLVDATNAHDRYSPVAKKILGKQLVIPVTVRFEWDGSTAQVTGIYFCPDLITPLMKILGNLNDVSLALDNPHLASRASTAS
ncbi:hypothetical protein GN244_ATG02015 [Phytophthora infestans]|uniref:BZIP domain-containing protein n=1 Tax=Phytophthora infestans TaxID=4787 RepID=A0A833SCB0_PHYIN|nr:hypothetical protein GN244_ATG02015 [Phytophthora infestans]KAF4128983.1 hypothetical protein GN958_ATG21814 [Phytophthora infestans]